MPNLYQFTVKSVTYSMTCDDGPASESLVFLLAPKRGECDPTHDRLGRDIATHPWNLTVHGYGTDDDASVQGAVTIPSAREPSAPVQARAVLNPQNFARLLQVAQIGQPKIIELTVSFQGDLAPGTSDHRLEDLHASFNIGGQPS